MGFETSIMTSLPLIAKAPVREKARSVSGAQASDFSHSRPVRLERLNSNISNSNNNNNNDRHHHSLHHHRHSPPNQRCHSNKPMSEDHRFLTGSTDAATTANPSLTSSANLASCVHQACGSSPAVHDRSGSGSSCVCCSTGVKCGINACSVSPTDKGPFTYDCRFVDEGQGSSNLGLVAGLNRSRSGASEMALSAVMMSRGSGASRQGNSNMTLNNIHENSIWRMGNDDIDDDNDNDDNASLKCTCDKLKGNRETVMLNIGGQIFETYKRTLKRLKTCKLANDKEMGKYYREEQRDYFFDRDPVAFNIILNYLRYGDLHLPTHLCGPALMREFQFWGIDEQDIERCCFQPYNTWKTQTKSLEKLEYDRKQSTTQTDLAQDRQSRECWRRFRASIWTFLQDPTSSLPAKIYAWISIIFVFMSIFSFCAETHPFFQLPPSKVHDFRTLYRFFALEGDSVLMTASRTKSAVVSASNVTETVTVGNDTFTRNVTAENVTQPLYDEDERIQHPALLIIDLACVFFFTVEFVTRLIFSPKKIRFCTSLQNIIDFVAIVPDYVEFILLSISPTAREGLPFMDFIFILRMLRLCRIFRLIRHVPGLWILLYTLKASFNELLLMFVFLLIGMVVFASLMHFAEDDKDFNNIPVGFWWAVVTMTTVGYGDMFPRTAYGYIIGSLCAISGLLMIAFTVPIIVSNFVLYYTHVQYGISDKDEAVRKITNIANEMETCSLHTSLTETSMMNKRISPDSERTCIAELSGSESCETPRGLIPEDGECETKNSVLSV